jgi:hypothetical protein
MRGQSKGCSGETSLSIDTDVGGGAGVVVTVEDLVRRAVEKGHIE